MKSSWGTVLLTGLMSASALLYSSLAQATDCNTNGIEDRLDTARTGLSFTSYNFSPVAEFCDVDGDGRLDVVDAVNSVVRRRLHTTVSTYKNLGSGQIALTSAPTLKGLHVTGVSILPQPSGLHDIVVSESDKHGRLKYYRLPQKKNGRYGSKTRYRGSVSSLVPCSIPGGIEKTTGFDFNHDGFADAAMAVDDGLKSTFIVNVFLSSPEQGSFAAKSFDVEKRGDFFHYFGTIGTVDFLGAGDENLVIPYFSYIGTRFRHGFLYVGSNLDAPEPTANFSAVETPLVPPLFIDLENDGIAEVLYKDGEKTVLMTNTAAAVELDENSNRVPDVCE